MKTLDARYVRHCSGERQTFGVAVGGVSGLFSGACRCLVGNEGNRQVSQNRKNLEQSRKRPRAIIMRGAHDDGSHSSKCLMGLRPGGNAVALAYRAYEPQALCQHLRLTL